MNGIVIQTLVSFLLSVPTVIVAVGNTWPSYALQILESDNSPLGYKITKNEASLIGSVVMLGSLTSILFAGYICDKIGRKRTEILSGLSYTLAWSIIATAKSATQLIIGRYMIGFGTGMHIVAGVIYIGEISQTSIRGTLLSIMSFMYNVGTLVSYTEGWFCSYDVTNYLNLSTAVSFVVLLLCIKETPIYLLRRGKEKEAIKSLKFYRGASTITQEILDEIVSMRSQLTNDINIDNHDSKPPELDYENEKLNKENETAKQNITKQSVWSTLRTSKSTQRALVILVVNMDLAVFMGMIGVQAYAGQFFTQAAPNLSPHLCSVILAIVQSVISGLTVVITDLIPRRVLMITSCLLSAGCMACLGTMLRWAWAPEWGIPLIMVLYCITYHLGVTNIPFVQIAECLPPHMNSFGTAVVMCSMFISNFTVLFVFKPAVDILGLDGLFLLFAIIGLFTAAVAFLVMRETRRVDFDITQNMFENGYVYQRHKYS